MSLASTRKTYGYGWARKITKWAAFRAGLSLIARDLPQKIERISIDIISLVILPITGVAIVIVVIVGAMHAFWLTTPPQTTPMWFVWMTRASALALVGGLVVRLMHHVIAVGRQQLEINALRTNDDGDAHPFPKGEQ